MAEPYKHIYKIDLNQPLKRFDVGDILASGDEKANSFEVTVCRDGANVDLTGCAVYGYFIRPNEETMMVRGSVSGNKACVDLSKNCYVYDGAFSFAIKITGNGITQTVAVFDGRIVRTTSENIVDGDRVIYGLEDLLAQIAATEAAASSANTAAKNANTATSRANAAAETIEKAQVPTGTVVTYQVGTSAATPPTGTWLTNVPTVPQGRFLWTRIVQSFANADPLTYYSVARQGMDGSGSVVSINGVAPDANGNVPVRKVFEEDGNQYITFSVSDSGVRITENVYGSYLYFRSDGTTGKGNVTVRDVNGTVINQLYGTTNKPTASDVGALPSGGTAVDASKLGNKAPEHYLQPRNLLDNSYWEHPKEIVNQRGRDSSFGAGFGNYNFIDRWTTYGANTTFSISDGGILIENDGSSTCGIAQLFEKGLIQAGKQYTLACKLSATNNNVVLSYGCGFSTITASTEGIPAGNSAVHVLSFTAAETTDGLYNFRIRSSAKAVTCQVEWVALYEGIYTAGTLPPYVPKGYSAEFEECKRYYRRFGSTSAHSMVLNGFISSSATIILLTLPEYLQMRKVPVLTAKCKVQIRGVSGYTSPGGTGTTSLSDGVFGIQADDSGDVNMITINRSDGLAFENATNNTPITVYFLGGSLLEFSADIKEA